MAKIRVSATRAIDARPEQVWAMLVDYRQAHPAILPKPYFQRLEVEQGGYGAGTVARIWMEMMGMKREYRLQVSEPEPGRVLFEQDPQAGVETTFTVEPVDSGRQSRVTIATLSRPSAGLAGVMERLLNPLLTRQLRRIYQAELENLAKVVER